MQLYYFVAALLVGSALAQIPDIHPDIAEDARLTTTELARKYGYPAEEHTITTSDGYILELHRIPGSPQSPPAFGKPVAFLMHGMLSSSACWVLMGPYTALAYMLADQGYDVWMGNARGNRYSNRHAWLNTNFALYWQFSWDEVGTTDLPQSIDYIISQTGQPRIHYIGHSQGTTVFWVMASMRPAYNDKIIAMHALAPSAYMHHTRSPYVIWLATFLTSTQIAMAWMRMYSFSPTTEMNIAAGERDCRDGAPFQQLCANEIFLLAGWNTEELNMTMLPVINGHNPAGASTMQMIHFGQNVRARAFRRYDHGIFLNPIHYGSLFPPQYNLGAVRAPVFLYQSFNDWLAPPEDVALLARRLPNIREQYMVSMRAFNHMDFVWAINQRTLLHNHVLSNMRASA